MTVPTARAHSTGGSTRPRAGTAVGMAKAATMATAIIVASSNAAMIFKPKGRKTPATMAMTMGMGIAAMMRRTSPVMPRKAMNTPQTR